MLLGLTAFVLALGSPTCELRGDLSSPSLRIAAPGGPALVRIEPLFGLTFTDLQMIGPAEMERAPVAGDPLAMAWDHPRARVVLRVEPQPDRVLFRADVTCKSGAILHVAVPFSFVLEGDPVERVLWPQGLGVELSSELVHSDRVIGQDYPPLFCDFVAARVGGEWLHFYRCEDPPPVRPSVWAMLGGPAPTIRHYYATCVRAGETWRTPAVACQVGGDLRGTLLRYKRECGLGRSLAEKMGPGFHARWVGMAEAMLAGPFDRMAATAERLPLPAVVEPATWMLGGFDRKYPDFLPPRAAFGGEAGFRRFVETAHAHGHLVRPYVNSTWWCTGWDGPDSEPAPSYLRYGDAPLSRNLQGERLSERYGVNYGYRVTPSHPVAAQRRLEVRDALLDDYGVDYLYLDQLGARDWAPDTNPALANPADYGAALMATALEDAARCPIETEFGHDRMLAAASALNFWCLPPLAVTPFWPGTPPPESELHLVRPFPYGLYLSTGDAVVNIPDSRDPARLAWSLLLGGRVSLGWAVDERVGEGPERARVEFLQRLAQAMGEGVVGDRLTGLDYLAPRVCRSTFEHHTVLANLAADPWPTEHGAALAPGGYELRADTGLWAGHYLGADGHPVSVALAPGRPGRVLARRGFRLDLSGSRRLLDDSKAPPATVSGRRCAVLDMGPAVGGHMAGGLTADQVRQAFADLSPRGVSNPDGLRSALRTARVVVNAHPEHLPCETLDDWPTALSRIRAWCEASGVWVEVAGYPMWIAAAPDASVEGGWSRRPIWQAGLRDLCDDECALPTPLPAAGPVTVTAVGRTVLSPATVSALEALPAVVARPLIDPAGTIVVAEGAAGGYITVRPIGHGALVRVAGVPSLPALAALSETAQAIVDGRLGLGPPAWRTPCLFELR